MRIAPTIATIAVVGGLAAVSLAVFGPGPNSTVVPSTGQTLAVSITEPSDNSTVLVPPGTATVTGTCTIGAPPGQPINVLYVLDLSGSTDLNFMTQNGIAGDAGDNFNAAAGDTEAGEVLDGEIAGVLSLHASIGNPSNVNVGLEAFATNAAAADVGPQAGIQVFTSPPQQDANGLAGPDINEVVRTFRSEFTNPAGGSIGKFTAVSQSVLGSATSFKKALQVMNTTLAQFPAAPTQVVFFLSDGESNQDGRCFQGACTAELNAAVAAHITIDTVGVGADADGTDLQFIATATGGTYTQVTDPSELSAVLPTISPAGIDRVEVNGVPVPLGPLGNFTATANCAGFGSRTVTATCFASDPAATNVSADVTFTCAAAPTTTTTTTSSTTVPSTTITTTTVVTTTTSTTSTTVATTTTSTTTTTTVTTTSTTSTTVPPACGNGVLEPGEDCDDGNTQSGDCCSATCHAEAAGTTCGPSPTQCSARQCNGAGSCVTNLLPNGTPCDDGDVCTENDQCDSGGVCTGQGGPDSDGDGECDRKEIACGCDPNDPKEGCLLPNRLGGLPFNRAGEVLLTYYSPTRTSPNVTTDEACDQTGECSDDGRCVRGKIRDVCTTNADCAEPFDTCRFIVNWAGISDLTLDSARLGPTDLPAFMPVAPGCSRRVDVTVGPTRSVLRLKGHGTIDGRLWRDRDVFKPHH